MPTSKTALPGRENEIPTTDTHFINGNNLHEPYPDTMEKVQFGMGCFWGVERLFWAIEGIHVTAVGYAGGFTPNPTYQETITGLTGHTEMVLVVYDPKIISFSELLTVFWEGHDPTQGMRQGNDIGSTYRSAIYTYSSAQLDEANKSKAEFQNALNASGRTSKITTELKNADHFYFAEGYHQQYLAKNPGGYCGLKGTGVKCV